MHELHFMRDIVSGAEFVLGVLNDTLPCELTLVHVFDINTGQFVLVRANGPGSDKLVLFRTPGSGSVVRPARCAACTRSASKTPEPTIASTAGAWA